MRTKPQMNRAGTYATDRRSESVRESVVPSGHHSSIPSEYALSISPSETNSFRSTIHGIGTDMGRVALGLGLAVFRGIEVIDVSLKVAMLRRQLYKSEGEYGSNGQLWIQDKEGFRNLMSLLSYTRTGLLTKTTRQQILLLLADVRINHFGTQHFIHS
ncbi:hypothetical protein QCA50_011709 [Cerrena zonata]|uniref:Uncharacterized protein n=1 Tax=Cerrena zonata TaxID=2478898 RepID=A0AAW0G8I5_9APHY